MKYILSINPIIAKQTARVPPTNANSLSLSFHTFIFSTLNFASRIRENPRLPGCGLMRRLRRHTEHWVHYDYHPLPPRRLLRSLSASRLASSSSAATAASAASASDKPSHATADAYIHNPKTSFLPFPLRRGRGKTFYLVCFSFFREGNDG